MKRFFILFFKLGIIAVIILAFLTFVGVFDTVYYNGPDSTNYEDKKFHNLVKTREKGLFALLKWKFTSDPNPWPKWVDSKPAPKPTERIFGRELKITFVNHTTFLIQTAGLNILTDPIWSDSVGPCTLFQVKRVQAPGIKFEDLPPIDIILISHNHYDHLDIPTLKRLNDKFKPLILTGLGNAAGIIEPQIGECNCIEMDWWQERNINFNLDITYTPAHHWSARGLLDRNTALWGAFVLSTSKGNVYFSGDTGFASGKHFELTQNKFGDFVMALLPIGSYLPRDFMRTVHMSPDDSVKAMQILQAKNAIAMHYKTFQLGDDGYDEGVKDLEKILKKENYPRDKFLTLGFGDSWTAP